MPTDVHYPLENPALWGGFLVFLVVALLVDLGIDRRSRAQAMTARAALIWTALWIALALCFNGLIWHWFGEEKAEEFLAGYLLEKSLSVDNLFVFLLVFAYFKVPPRQQRRVLVWGIIGAALLRAVMILLGAALIEVFEPTLAIFGAFLVWTSIKLVSDEEDDPDPSQSWVVRTLGRLLPMTEGSRAEEGGNLIDGYRGDKFYVIEGGGRRFTPLFLVLLVIEASDVLFAVDSVPAIFGVTKDPFIVFTSNMFAILGLRALFFAVAAAIQRLRFLNVGLAIVLGFIGVKMLLPFAYQGLRAAGVEVSPTLQMAGITLLEEGHGTDDHGDAQHHEEPEAAQETEEKLSGWKVPTKLSLLVIVVVLGLTTGISLTSPVSGDDEVPDGAEDGEPPPDQAEAQEPQGEAAK